MQVCYLAINTIFFYLSCTREMTLADVVFFFFICSEWLLNVLKSYLITWGSTTVLNVCVSYLERQVRRQIVSCVTV